jgi:Tfp pilus assembly protein PilW
MKRSISNHRGFTTVEFLGAALCGAIVLSALYSFYREQLFSLLLQETKTATLEDARGALDIMVRELRNAGLFPVIPLPTDSNCLKDSSGKPLRVVSASSVSIQIQTDTESTGGGDPDGKCTATGESVTYAIGSGTDVCPGPMTIKRNGNCLVANVVVSSKEPLFTYFDISGTQLGGNPAVADVKRVRIRFSVEVPDPTPQGKSLGKTIKSTLSSSVEFRNS